MPSSITECEHYKAFCILFPNIVTQSGQKMADGLHKKDIETLLANLNWLF